MQNNLETTIGAFEKRMAMRRKMLHVTGVELPNASKSAEIERIFRETVVNCFDCKSADYCAAWLEAVDPGVEPPEFCPNSGAIRDLRKMGRVR